MPLTNLPRVGGTGPLFERRPAIAPGNRPRFGSNWRLWAVRLPASARLFVPPDRGDEWEARSPRGGLGGHPAAGGAAARRALRRLRPRLDRHAYKVLLDGGCLAGPTLTLEQLAACPWLDSQEALERLLPAALVPSEILVACPFCRLRRGGRPHAPRTMTRPRRPAD